MQVPDNLLYGQKKKVTPKETVVEPGSVKTVTSNIEIPKAPAKAPKAQKAYLIDALDTAIKEAKETANPTGSVLIEIPGDGQFKIQNNEIMLESFRKTVKSHFPENLPKPKGYKAYPSTKATGKRITSEDVEYYNEFAPRKEAVKQTSNSRWAYSTDGFATDGVYAVKTKKPGDAGLAEDMKVLDIVPAELKPANIIGEFRNQFDNEGNVYAHLVAKTGEDTVIPAKQLDIILTEHPTATAFISEQGKPVVFKVGKEVAGLISPIKGGDPYLQYRGSLSDRTLEIVNQKGIDISKYTANKLEAIRLEIEKTKSRITDIKKNIEEYTTKGRDDLLGYEQSTLETNTAELKELGDLLDKTEGLADGTLLSKDKGPGTSTLFTGVDISRAKESPPVFIMP